MFYLITLPLMPKLIYRIVLSNIIFPFGTVDTVPLQRTSVNKITRASRKNACALCIDFLKL